MPNFTAIIPARYASSRFPGKPLAKIGQFTMIERVYRQVTKAVSNVWVATDDNRIFEAVESFGGNCVMTSADHQSGTDRIREAAEKVASRGDVIINVQGDEPFINPRQIELIKRCFANEDVKIASLARPFDKSRPFSELQDPNLVKVVLDQDSNALYFSRSVIPYVRGVEQSRWPESHQFFTHIGMYAYTTEALLEVTSLKRSSLEVAESLEQLRWLQAGYKIKMAVSDDVTIGIDTPADLEAANEYALVFDAQNV